MTDLRGRTFSELVADVNAGQHLAVDAVVALVDGELDPGAYDRAVAHVGRCPGCAAEVASQRQARTAVRAAAEPSTPAGLLAALRSIPETVELPRAPDGLAVTDDGTVVQAVPEPDGGGVATGARLGSSPPLGSSARLGDAGSGFPGAGGRRAAGRRKPLWHSER